MERLGKHPMVMTTVVDQCAYGLMSRDAEGEAPAKKPTKFFTDSIGVKNQLTARCPGCARHVQLMAGALLTKLAWMPRT